MIRKIKGTGGGGTGVTHGADGARRKGGRGGLKERGGKDKGGKGKLKGGLLVGSCERVGE